jgi:ParB family chromosome partitioning protein
MIEHNMTQEQLSEIVGKSRSAIANTVRLLVLCQKVKDFIIQGKLSSGHARTLIAIEDEELQKKIADEIIEKALNVREAEKLLKKFSERKKKIDKNIDNVEYNQIEEKLKAAFGTQVKLLSGNKKGKIVIEYYSPNELDRILTLVDSMDKK